MAQQQVDLLAAAVLEHHVPAVQSVDIGFDGDVAVLEMVQQLGVEQRVTFEQAMVRLGQPQPGQVSVDQAQQGRKDRTRQPHGQMRTGFGDLVDRNPHQVLGNEVIAAAHAEKGALRLHGRLAGDVRAGVTGTQHQHALAAEFVAMPETHRVADVAIEVAWQLRHAGVPVDARCADDRGVDALRAIGQRHLPAPVRLFVDAQDGGVELDLLAQTKRLGEAAQVGQDLSMRRVVGVMARHGMADEGR